MDFSLSEDQRLIREGVARFVADRTRRPPGIVGFDHELWRSMADMGWLAAGVSEAHGGFGGPIELALVAEELGRGAIGGDYLGAGVLGPQLLVASGDTVLREELLPQILAGEVVVAGAFSERGTRGNLSHVQTAAKSNKSGFNLSGTKTLVLAGDVANQILVSARTSTDVGPSQVSLFLVDPSSDGVTVVPTPSVDGSSAATIHLEAAPGKMVGEPGKGLSALTAMSEHAVACMVAESVGAMEAVAEITASYFRTRKQFGVSLGTFQVLQHKLADMTIDAEMARATLHVALAAFELQDAVLRRRRFSGAKAAAGEALRRVTGSGVQSHGGMGMTIEYPVGRYLQRMVVLDAVLGSPAHHLEVCAASLAGSRPQPRYEAGLI